MTAAILCDRCHQHTVPFGTAHIETTEGPNSWVVPREFDLCHDCSRDLVRWMNAGVVQP